MSYKGYHFFPYTEGRCVLKNIPVKLSTPSEIISMAEMIHGKIWVETILA